MARFADASASKGEGHADSTGRGGMQKHATGQPVVPSFRRGSSATNTLLATPATPPAAFAFALSAMVAALATAAMALGRIGLLGS